MSFNARQRAAIRRWSEGAAPLEGTYFRSVEYRYMDPRDVLSGAGTRMYGGRFAPLGTRAVYLSASDSGAGKEVTARKARLGGAAQITTDKYPRVVYAVAVDLARVLHLSALGKSRAGDAVRKACLNVDDLSASIELGRMLVADGIQGLLFTSAIGGDNNLIVYRAHCGKKALTIQHEKDVIEEAKKIAAKH